jgi:tRNA-splicing ligase RtcB
MSRPDKPFKIYSEGTEHMALNQFFDALSQPFAIRGALMADAHCGYSLPIGGVVATDGVVVPAWIGFDIGCGVCAMRTRYTRDQIVYDSVSSIYAGVRERIPMGFNHHKHPVSWRTPPMSKRGERIFYEKGGLRQLGTLGGGNHFIEVGYDEDGYVWVVVHSGSRGVGHGIATQYMKIASGTNKAKEGHYGFELNTPDGIDYIIDMEMCLEFALFNRYQIIDEVLRTMSKVLGGDSGSQSFINRNHNHAEIIDGNVVIHRKGATHAGAGMMGVIPGNMKDGSFIVEGLGNPDSLNSSSHGAGRVMGRREAKQQLDVKLFTEMMSDARVYCDANEHNIDESPLAYKDIFKVMEEQNGLVKVLHHIKPIMNWKG